MAVEERAGGDSAMTLTISRHKPEPPPPPAPEQPRFLTAESMGRTDLLCAACGQRIAFGIDTARLDTDAPFYLDAHAPFCRSGHL
jgi:hypothetical protein